MAEAIELAVAYISIAGETDKLARSVKDAMRDAQRYATANPINIKANVDVSHIGSIEIPVTADTTRFDNQVRDAIRDAQAYATANPIEIRANIDVSHVGAVTVDVNPNMARFADQVRDALRNMERSGLFQFNIPVDLDSAAALARMAALRRELERMASPIRQEVEVDVDRSSLDRLGRLGSVGITSAAAGLTAAAGAGLAAIGGAAGAALGAVGALGAGIAALGPAALAAGATAAVGLQGIGDAFKTLSAAEAASGADGQAQAKAVAAAQEQVASALDNVETAQRTLTDAQKDAKDAAADIAQAYKDAADELEDYNLKVKDSALSEKEAALALKDAQKDLAKAKPEDREKALLRVERAELRLAEAQEKNRDTQEEAADAQKKGVEGSDKVVAAKDKAAQADQRVADAQKAVQKANEQVAKAQQAVADAANASSSAQDKAAAALAKLSPEARAWVLAVREMTPAWTDLRNAVQESLFDDAAAGIKELANAALPTLKAGMVDVAGSMNGLTKQFAAFWAAPQNLEGVRAIFAGTANFIDGLGPGLQQATQGFLSLGQAFEPVANQVGAQFAGMLGQVGQAFTDAFESGALTQLLSTFGDILQGLGEGLNPLIAGLIEMGNIVGPTLGPFFKQFGESIKALAPSFGALGATFMTTLTTLLPPLQGFLSALATGLQPVLPVIGKLLESLFTALTPLIEPMSQIAVTIGNALIGALNALAPAMGPLGTAFAALITAIAPLLPVIAQVVADLIVALAPALTKIFEALGPVITQWADLMMPVFKQLQPILADVAMKIADALVGALNQLAPYLPDIAKSFGDLVTAVAPLLPQLVEIAVSLLPPLLDLFIAILPQLLKLIDAFTWLVTNVIQPLVLPALKSMADSFGSQLQFAADAVTKARDVIGGAVEKIGEFFSDVGATIAAVWNGVVHGIAVAVKKIGELLQQVKIPDWVPGVGGEGAGSLGDSLVNWANAHMAGGGLLHGRGTGTSDSMLIAASTGEFVVNAAATSKTLPLLEAINAGWTPSAAFLHAMVPGFAEGGQVPGKKFAQSMDSAGYLMGGFSRTSIDCSGMVSAVVNDALGLNPFASRMSTVSEGQWLAAKGALQGKGKPGDISIGWYDRGGGANGHTAMTLGDGTNVESNGSDGVIIGGPVGANASMFDKHMYIPAALLRGGDLGGPATGTGAAPVGAGALGGGGATGGGVGTGAGTGGAGGGGGAANTSGATPVFVVNWPTTAGTSTQTAATESTPSTDVTSGSTPMVDSSAPSVTTSAQTGELTRWWEAPTPEQAVQQLGNNLSTVDVPGRLTSALADFGTANLDQIIGDIGARRSGGAIQELVKVIQTRMAAEIAEQLRRSRTSATSFVGRR